MFKSANVTISGVFFFINFVTSLIDRHQSRHQIIIYVLFKSRQFSIEMPKKEHKKEVPFHKNYHVSLNIISCNETNILHFIARKSKEEVSIPPCLANRNRRFNE